MENVAIKKKFLFDESSEINLKLKIYYKEKGDRTSVIIDAAIKYKAGNLTLYTEDIQTLKNLDGVFNLLFRKGIKKKDFKVIEASVDGQTIDLKIDEQLLFTRSYSENGKMGISMSLHHINYSYKDMSHSKCYRLSAVSSKLLSGYLTGFVHDGNTVVGTRPEKYVGKCFNWHISLTRDEQYVYLETDDDISGILSVLSFFFCSPVEYDMIYVSDQKGGYSVEVSSPKYKMLSVKENNVLRYLFNGKVCLDYLMVFLDVSKHCGKECMITDDMKLYIDHYVRVEYLDNISKLLLYHAIIEKMAGVGKKEDTYNIISEYLKGFNINVERINDGIDKKKIKNEDSNYINNFVQLRNFFVHHLGSKEAVDFLKESNLLFNMKAAITIIILNKMGIQGVCYDKHFSALSIFDDNVMEGNVIC